MKDSQLTDFMIKRCNRKRSEDIICLRLRRKAYKRQCWSPTNPMWILLWYSDSQLFVCLCLCEFKLENTWDCHKKDMGMSIKNALIDRNTTSDHAGLNCERYEFRLCALCDQTAFKFIDLQQQIITDRLRTICQVSLWFVHHFHV